MLDAQGGGGGGGGAEGKSPPSSSAATAAATDIEAERRRMRARHELETIATAVDVFKVRVDGGLVRLGMHRLLIRSSFSGPHRRRLAKGTRRGGRGPSESKEGRRLMRRQGGGVKRDTGWRVHTHTRKDIKAAYTKIHRYMCMCEIRR